MLGIILAVVPILFGILYLRNPNIYRGSFYVSTMILPKILGPVRYIKFMKILGIIFLVIGILLIIFTRTITDLNDRNINRKYRLNKKVKLANGSLSKIGHND